MRRSISFIAPVFAAALIAGCSDHNSNTKPTTTNAAAKAAAPVTGGYLETLVQAKQTADKTIDASYLNQAINQFNVQEGRYPKTLQELTPNYVAKIPPPPVGYKFDYNPVKGEMKVVPQ